MNKLVYTFLYFNFVGYQKEWQNDVYDLQEWQNDVYGYIRQIYRKYQATGFEVNDKMTHIVI